MGYWKVILHDLYNPITHPNGYVIANDVTYQPIRWPEILALANLFGKKISVRMLNGLSTA